MGRGQARLRRSRRASAARAVIYDPPYSRYSPMRGRGDGTAGSVAAPFSFMHRTVSLAACAVQPKGIVMVFSDWELLGDITSPCGLREHQHLARFRSCSAGGRLFGGACAPVLIASRTPPNRVEAAVRNRIVAGYELSRPHPYSKPPAVSEYVLARVCRQSDLVLDPVAGSGSSRTAAEAVRHSVLASRRDGGGGGH